MSDLKIFKKALAEVVDLSEKDSRGFPLDEVYWDLMTCLKSLIKEDHHILIRLNNRSQ